MTLKTPSQWQSELTPEEYRVCREQGTERPFTGTLLSVNDKGEYFCKCCQAKLFDSESKFDAHCGWPSFDQHSEEDNVAFKEDNSHGMQRIEIVCKQCDAHLGHIFDDGPTRTGKRYCVNSVSLTFKNENGTIQG
ncbi:peptide-methionine (R)-S-oxide reductase MsrB [Aestuariibacter sp. AA17]|uniref:peptide-methionine (R)-S-oxide reductase n=1 Tax=Fluctibacter corallii TaxID=2984329 RepID=A0ABT3A6G2_9ALTE|nr:peptide-methionine (R)-S-oxide reductase MsrB [Aestuariibacter sp. AA17]MCV2884243.1 peptide-methionine (R)-S-oxide reductase MsrB [Aestuariibacter sp. AA17]